MVEHPEAGAAAPSKAVIVFLKRQHAKERRKRKPKATESGAGTAVANKEGERTWWRMGWLLSSSAAVARRGVEDDLPSPLPLDPNKASSRILLMSRLAMCSEAPLMAESRGLFVLSGELERGAAGPGAADEAGRQDRSWVYRWGFSELACA